MKTYKIIPAINTIKFVREVEFKYKILNLSEEDKINKIFENNYLLRNSGILDADIIEED